MIRHLHRLLLASAPAAMVSVTVFAQESVVLNHPDYPFFHATAMDQPRTNLLLVDGDQVLGNGEEPTVINAFVDTGSSGFVLSNLHVTGEYAQAPALGIGQDDFIGAYTNVGIGGEEIGWVSRPFTVRLHNDPFPSEGEIPLADFIPYGEHNLWVRQAPGMGEVTEMDLGEGFVYQLVSPVNIVGMPVIEQRTMTMEWTPLPPELQGILPEHALPLQTKLLPGDDPAIPVTNATLDLEMRDMTGEAPPGETLPTFSRNPLVKHVTVSHDPDRPGVTDEWLFDTGAGSSFISFRWAQQIGLIPENYPDLQSFVVDHEAAGGLLSAVGGIGPGSVRVPILTVNEIRVPAKEGFDLVWENVNVLVFEHEELAELDLQGIFGMNLIAPAATLDSALLESLGFGDDAAGNQEALALLLTMLSDITPTPVRAMVFDVTGESTAELRLFSNQVAIAGGPFDSWARVRFTPEQLADPTVSAPESDPDGDGLTNLVEYALGRDPMSSTGEEWAQPEVREIDGSPYLTLSYERIEWAEDLEFIVEASDDLKTWNTVETIIETVDLGNRERVTVRDNQPLDSHEQRFLRLRVKLTGQS